MLAHLPLCLWTQWWALLCDDCCHLMVHLQGSQSDDLLPQIEHQLGNLDRCRRLYERYLAWNPANCQAWCRFADLERSLAETDRTRALFELAIQQPLLDMPEVLWKVGVETWECAA